MNDLIPWMKKRTPARVKDWLLRLAQELDKAIAAGSLYAHMVPFQRLIERRLRKRLGHLRINVGSGTPGVRGWVNITLFANTLALLDRLGVFTDPSRKLIVPYGGTTTVPDGTTYLHYDVTHGLPFRDNAVEAIFSSHFIEHITFDQGVAFVKDAFRVLKPGGVIRLSCPDLYAYAKSYVARDARFFRHPLIREWCVYPGAKTFGEIFIAKAYDGPNGHKWFYDFESLQHILHDAGFRNIRQKQMHESRILDIKKLEPPRRSFETVYVEALK